MEIERLLSGASENLTVRRCFGEPVVQDGTLVIPVAFVAGGGGGGEGDEGHPGEAGAEREAAVRAGRGGGFGGVTWPLGVYVVREGRVRWVPAVDATRIVLGALALARGLAKIVAARRMRVTR
jgi:uncharacterized spore protein YtfJ